MKLYIHPMSSNARRARLVAHHLGLQPELITVDLSKGAQKAPEYLALNPNGKVPTLVDGNVVIWESIAIGLYLCEKTPGQSLYATNDLATRTQQNKWLFWTAHHWNTACGTLVYERMLKKLFGQGEPNEYAVKRGEAFFHDTAKVLDAQLQKTKYVMGDALTIVDLAIAPPLMYAQAANLPMYTQIARWFEELQQLAAWRATQPQ